MKLRSACLLLPRLLIDYLRWSGGAKEANNETLLGYAGDSDISEASPGRHCVTWILNYQFC